MRINIFQTQDINTKNHNLSYNFQIGVIVMVLGIKVLCFQEYINNNHHKDQIVLYKCLILIMIEIG